MARFDVFRHPDTKRRRQSPFFLSIRSETLDFLRTRVVVPRVAERSFGPRLPFLRPVIRFEPQAVVLATNELVAVELALLGHPVGNASSDASAIISSLDDLVSGH